MISDLQFFIGTTIVFGAWLLYSAFMAWRAQLRITDWTKKGKWARTIGFFTLLAVILAMPAIVYLFAKGLPRLWMFYLAVSAIFLVTKALLFEPARRKAEALLKAKQNSSPSPSL